MNNMETEIEKEEVKEVEVRTEEISGKEIQKINVWSVAKLLGVIYALMGLIGSLFFLVMALFGGTESSVETIFVIASIIFLPIMYGAGGFIGGAIFGWIYNLLAKKVGGVVIYLGDKE